MVFFLHWKSHYRRYVLVFHVTNRMNFSGRWFSFHWMSLNATGYDTIYIYSYIYIHRINTISLNDHIFRTLRQRPESWILTLQRDIGTVAATCFICWKVAPGFLLGTLFGDFGSGDFANQFWIACSFHLHLFRLLDTSKIQLSSMHICNVYFYFHIYIYTYILYILYIW